MPCKNHPEEVIGLVGCSRCGGDFCRSCIVELGGSFYCADCKGEQVRDIQSGADATALDLASIGRRWAALMIDSLVLMVPVVVAVLLALSWYSYGPGSDTSAAAFPQQFFQLAVQLGVTLVYVIYEALMLGARGQTLGKMAMSIKVVTAQGNDISVGQAWGRAIVRGMFNILSVFGLINYIAALFGKQKKCLHDSIAKTRVIDWRP